MDTNFLKEFLISKIYRSAIYVNIIYCVSVQVISFDFVNAFFKSLKFIK